MSYKWSFIGSKIQSTEKNPSFTFNKAVTYTVGLKVTDTEGLSSSTTTKILVGNDPPEIAFELKPNDSIYRDGEKVNYKIIVRDVQEGNIEDGTIDPKDVKVALTYIPEGKDLVNAFGHQRVVISECRKIIDGSDCKACQASNEKINGRSYEEIAAKYSPLDVHYLVSKVIKGGS